MGNNEVCVSPVLTHCSILVPTVALGLWTRRSGSEQDSCVWDHTSLLQRGLTTAQKQPKNHPSNPPILPARMLRKPLQGSPGRFQTWASPLSFVPLAFKAGQEPLLLLSARSEPRASLCHLAHRLGSLLCVCVCVCISTRILCACVCECVRIQGCTFGKVLRYMPALLFEHCLRRCVARNSIVHVHKCACVCMCERVRLPNSPILSGTGGLFRKCISDFGSAAGDNTVGFQHTTGEVYISARDGQADTFPGQTQP